MSYLRTKLPESLPAETVRGFSADLKGLCEWLETQDPAAEYCFGEPSDCLFGRFHKAVGIAVVGHFAANPYLGPGLMALYPNAEVIGARFPHTYGAALKRARSALREGG